MRLEAAILGGLFVIGGLCGAAPDGMLGQLHRRHADVHDRMRRNADAAVHENEKRTLSTADVFGRPSGVWPTVTVPTGFTLAAGVELTPLPGSPTPILALAATATGAPLLANGSIDTTTWDAEAETACMNAMDMLNGNASNPTGLVVCYNVPYLSQTNGTFEAELRIFNVSMPTGEWMDVTASDMMVTLQYQGATIQASNNGVVPVKRDVLLDRRQMSSTSSMMSSSMATATSSGATITPSLVAVRTYVGEINQNLITPGMNISAMQPLLIPQISIEATNPTGTTLNTSLSATQASFVAGVFAMASAVSTDPKSILGMPSEQLAAEQAGSPTPFVVPGLALGVEPIGLVVTCIWTIFFFGAVGVGTVGRIRFRDQYRKQIREQKSETVRRF